MFNQIFCSEHNQIGLDFYNEEYKLAEYTNYVEFSFSY